MSTDRALLLVTVVVFIALALSWMGLRIWQASQTVATAVAEELDDRAPGTDVGWQDECELIWATPDTRHQRKDEQS